jgi:heterogeneous nuclear rnp K-like protein 2
MVGCIIGKGGSFISQIRYKSGAKLHISEQEEGRADRDVSIIGSDQSIQVALGLLLNQLQIQKEKNLEMANQEASLR